MAQAEQESDLGDELPLDLGGEGLVLLGLADELDGDISLLVNASVDPAVPTGGEFAANVELRQIGAPLLFPFSLYLRPGRHQVLRPRLRSVVFPQRQPPPPISAVTRDLLEPVQVLHAQMDDPRCGFLVNFKVVVLVRRRHLSLLIY